MVEIKPKSRMPPPPQPRTTTLTPRPTYTHAPHLPHIPPPHNSQNQAQVKNALTRLGGVPDANCMCVIPSKSLNGWGAVQRA